MALIRSLLFIAIFYPGSVIMVLAALASIPFGRRRSLQVRGAGRSGIAGAHAGSWAFARA